MNKVFLDTNFFMRLLEGQLLEQGKKLDTSERLISPLSIHIATYVHRLTMPDERFTDFVSHFTVVLTSPACAQVSLCQPTSDYEDNIQLNTAAEAGATIFYTLDKQLLALQAYSSFIIKSPMDL